MLLFHPGQETACAVDLQSRQLRWLHFFNFANAMIVWFVKVFSFAN